MEHHPKVLEGRDDIPHRELEKFMANTTEVLEMIEVGPTSRASTNIAESHCTAHTDAITEL